MNAALAQPARALQAARLLFTALIVAVLFSPALANLLWAVLLVLALADGGLRSRLARTWALPMVRACLAFLLWVAVASAWSAAPLPAALSELWGWRKLLLLPLGAALFDEAGPKLRLARTLLVVLVAAALLSFALYPGKVFLPMPDLKVPAIVIRNHATQAVVFALGAMVAAGLALDAVRNRVRILLALCALLLAANIAIVTSGRSGYVDLLIFAAGMSLHAASRFKSVRARWLSLGAVLLVGAGLALAPPVQKRLAQGIHELQSYERQEGVTDMGIRPVFWLNTLQIIRAQPLLGVGTGGFPFAYEKQVSGRSGVAATPAHDPHNQFMKITAEQGLAGLALFLGLLAGILRSHPVATLPRLWGWLALAGWCATSMVSSHFSTFTEGTLIFAWLGAMLGPEVPSRGPGDATVGMDRGAPA